MSLKNLRTQHCVYKHMITLAAVNWVYTLGTPKLNYHNFMHHFRFYVVGGSDTRMRKKTVSHLKNIHLKKQVT